MAEAQTSGGQLLAGNSSDNAARLQVQARKFTRKLRIFGVSSMVLGCSICASDLILLVSSSSSPAVVFSGVWSGMAFGVAGGVLALKAAARKTATELQSFLTSSICFYTISIVVHLVPLVCASLTLLLLMLFRSYNRNPEFTEILLEANEYSRLVMCALLIIVDVILLGNFRHLRYSGANDEVDAVDVHDDFEPTAQAAGVDSERRVATASLVATGEATSEREIAQQSDGADASAHSPPSYETVMQDGYAVDKLRSDCE